LGGGVPARAAIGVFRGDHGHLRRVAILAEPMCGASTALLHASNAGRTSGSAFEDIEAGGGDPALTEGAGKRAFVHHRTARSVDQNCSGLHHAEFGFANRVAGVWV